MEPSINKSPLYTNPDLYDNRYTINPLEQYLHDAWRAFLSEEVRKTVEKGDTVADLGAGTGINIPDAKNAERYYAVEISRDMLEYAKKKYEQAFPRTVFLVEDSVATSVHPGAADVVLSLGVFCYVDADAQVAEIDRVLKPGGTVLVTSPNAWNPFNMAIAFRNLFRGKKHRKHFDTARGLKHAFRKKGFVIEKVDSRATIFYVPKPLQKYALPIFRWIDRVYAPFQSFFPLGSDIYLVVTKQNI